MKPAWAPVPVRADSAGALALFFQIFENEISVQKQSTGKEGKV
jgi:hypothetical protein